MNTILRGLSSLVLLVLIALGLFIYWPANLSSPDDFTVTDDVMAWPAVDEADYPQMVANAADCMVCHTAEGGDDFAGGRTFLTPMGVIYSSNITPDPETGIGNYSLDDFRAALIDGIRKDGKYLYPAMPYNNYRFLVERDIQALYTYFTRQVEPIKATNRASEMKFPFNMRFGIRAWNWLAMPHAGFKGPGDPVLARGAYLVEGPSHCGSCHSPRDDFYMQTGYTSADESFLTGGKLNGWEVPPLRGADSAPAHWSAKELRAYLETGRNSFSASAGEMSGAIEHSLQYMPSSDLDAIVAYLRGLAPNGGGSAEGLTPSKGRGPQLWTASKNGGTAELLASADPSRLDLGARLYLDNCSACHLTDGKGGNGTFPELDGNLIVTSDQTGGLLDIILYGAKLPSTRKAPLRLQMPGFGDRLSDEEVAILANFLRSGWSNKAQTTVSVNDVGARR